MTSDHRNTLFITCCGSFSGLLANDILRTCLLAAAGTTVSFLVTLLLKRMIRKR
jgi:hypothetical protein